MWNMSVNLVALLDDMQSFASSFEPIFDASQFADESSLWTNVSALVESRVSLDYSKTAVRVIY